MESPDRLLGTVIDNRYRLSEFIGRGSYGCVFAAEEVTLGRVISRVAVKLIIPESEEQRQTVMNEIVGLARFHHDYVIAYRSSGQIAYGDLSGCLFLATELGDTTLAKFTKSGDRLSDDQLRETIRGVASALAHLHAQRAIHGDVKPANIIRVKDRWKLGDLGLLRSTSSKPAGPLHGSLTYLAPEMLRHEISPANDIYALGVTILYYFTGKYAHSGDSREEFIEHLRTLPPNISDALSEPWKSIIVQCLQRNPAHRMSAEQIELFLRSENARFPFVPPSPSASAASEVTVSPDGDGQFISIQAAIDAVAAGTEITVRPGKYRETLRIDKPLCLIGDGNPDQVVVTTRDAHCLELHTDEEVHIRGFTFRTRPGPLNLECYAVDLGQGRAVLEDCFIKAAAMPCVAIHDSASTTLRHCTISGGKDVGLFLFDGGTARLENCQISDHGRCGVTATDGGTATFVNCDIFANQSGGVFLFRGGKGTFEDCRIVGNAKAGVVIGPAGKADYRRCRIGENTGEGVVLQDGATATVVDCDLTGNAKGAWKVAPKCGLTRRGNVE